MIGNSGINCATFIANAKNEGQVILIAIPVEPGKENALPENERHSSFVPFG
jgi:hypothetical protein